MNIFYKKSYIVFTLTILLSFLYVPVLSASIICPADPKPGECPPFDTSTGGTQTSLAEGDLVSLVKGLIGVVNSVIILVVGLAVMVFIWGIVRYLYSAGDASARAEWRNYMIYGVIALTVITGIWGIVNGVASLLGIGFVGPVFPKLEPETVSMLSTVYLS